MYISNQHIKAAVYALVPKFQFRGCCSASSSHQIRLSLSACTPFPCTASSSEPLFVILFPGNVGTDGKKRANTLEQPETVSESKKLLSMTSVLVENKSHSTLCMHFERRCRKEGPKNSLYREHIRSLVPGPHTSNPTGITVMA